MASKGGSGTDKNVVQVRLEILQDFLYAILDNPELRSSPALLTFLSGRDLEFSRFIKESERANTINPNTVLAASGGFNRKLFYSKNPIKVESLNTLNGSTEVKITQSLKKFGVILKTALKEYTPNFSRCKELLEQLGNIQIQAKQTVDKICEHLTCLYSTTRKLGDTLSAEHLPRWDKLESVFSNLSSVMTNYGAGFEGQSKIIHHTIHKAISYSKKEITSLEELLKLREEASEVFYRNYVELDSRKDKLIKLGDYSKLGFDIEKCGMSKEDLLENKVAMKMLMLKDVVETCNAGHREGQRDAEILRIPEQPNVSRVLELSRNHCKTIREGDG